MSNSKYIFVPNYFNGGIKFEAKLKSGNAHANVPYMMALDLLSEGDADFTNEFLEVLRNGVGFAAFFFETPAMTKLKAYYESFEFVLMEARSLETVKYDPNAFSSYFSKHASSVAFENLGRDAKLIVPCPLLGKHDLQMYAHLASFVRNCQTIQVKEFFKMVCNEMKERLRSHDEVWMSTCETGISWLHVRLDSTPKYYSYKPYKGVDPFSGNFSRDPWTHKSPKLGLGGQKSLDLGSTAMSTGGRIVFPSETPRFKSEPQNYLNPVSSYSFSGSMVSGGMKFIAEHSGNTLSFKEALNLMANGDPKFLEAFLQVLRNGVGFQAYFFETPGMTKIKADGDPFEFVLLDAPGLAMKGNDPSHFSSYFKEFVSCVSFKNLTGDALLVAPCPMLARKDYQAYAHLAAFIRYAPAEHVKEFWQLASAKMRDVLRTNRAIWMSTCGEGVSWLSLRLDSSPKYYSFAPYKTTVSSFARHNNYWRD